MTTEKIKKIICEMIDKEEETKIFFFNRSKDKSLEVEVAELYDDMYRDHAGAEYALRTLLEIIAREEH